MWYIVKFDDDYDIWYKEFDTKAEAICYAESLERVHKQYRDNLWRTLFEIKEAE